MTTPAEWTPVPLTPAALELAEAVMQRARERARAGLCPHCGDRAQAGELVCSQPQCWDWLYAVMPDNCGRVLSDARMLADLAHPVDLDWRDLMAAGVIGAASAVVFVAVAIGVVVWGLRWMAVTVLPG